MNIIFTSESTGKASLGVRRVLDRFATRIGSDVWEAALTLEGLGTVKALLNRASSRKSSVACHRITQDGSRVLMWSVGNSRMFNQQGACSTGWTAKRLKREDANLPYPGAWWSGWCRLLGCCTILARLRLFFKVCFWGLASGRLSGMRRSVQ